jgi:hypothetical protein
LNHTLVQWGIKEEEGKQKSAAKKSGDEVKKERNKKVWAGLVFTVSLPAALSVAHAFMDGEKPLMVEEKSRTFPFSIIPEAIVRKAMDRDPFYYFDQLKHRFPHLHSVSEFISSKEWLGSIFCSVNRSGDNVLTADEKLLIATNVLTQVKAFVNA